MSLPVTQATIQSGFAITADTRPADATLKGVALATRVFGVESLEGIFLEGAEIYRDKVRGAVPIGPTGNLWSGVIATRLRPLGGSRAAALVGRDYRAAPHWHLVEGPVKERVPTKGRVMVTNEGQIIGKRAAAIPARPFFARSIRAARGGVNQHMQKRIKDLWLGSLRKVRTGI